MGNQLIQWMGRITCASSMTMTGISTRGLPPDFPMTSTSLLMSSLLAREYTSQTLLLVGDLPLEVWLHSSDCRCLVRLRRSIGRLSTSEGAMPSNWELPESPVNILIEGYLITLRYILVWVSCALLWTPVLMSVRSIRPRVPVVSGSYIVDEKQSGTALDGRTMEGRIRGAYKLAFSPNGRMLAAISLWEKLPKVWDVTTGKETLQLYGHKKSGYDSIAFSPDSKMIITGGHDRTARVWDA